jgi:hypothetical protein
MLSPVGAFREERLSRDRQIEVILLPESFIGPAGS